MEHFIRPPIQLSTKEYGILIVKLFCDSSNPSNSSASIYPYEVTGKQNFFFVFQRYEKQIKTVSLTFYILLLHLARTTVDLSSSLRCYSRSVQSINCIKLSISPFQVTLCYCARFQNQTIEKTENEFNLLISQVFLSLL